MPFFLACRPRQPESVFRRVHECRVRSRTDPLFPLPQGGEAEQSGMARVRVGLNRLRRCFEGYDAAGRAAAGYLSLLVQRKVTERKHAPEPPTPPALLAPAGREPNSPSAEPRASGSNTGSRTLPAGAAMLGGGYGDPTSKPTAVKSNTETEFYFFIPALRLCLGDRGSSIQWARASRGWIDE